MRYLAVALLLCVQLPATAQRMAVQFETADFAALQARARQENRPVFLYFWSTHCGPCVEMARDVFPDSAVARYYNATFRSFKADLDSELGGALGQRYGVRSLPAYLYFDPAGQLLHRTGGGKPAAALLRDGRDAFNPDKAYYTLKSRYEAGQRSPAFLRAFSSAPGLSDEPDLSRRVSNEYLRTQSAAELASPLNRAYIFNQYQYQYQDLDAISTQYFLRHQPDFAGQFGAPAVTKRTRNIISQAGDEAGRKKDAAALAALQKTIAQLMPAEADQWQQLAQLHFLLGQRPRNWPAYANAVQIYGRQFAKRDSHTLYEATAYMTAFVADKALLAQADLIIQLALAAEPSAANLLARAKLLHKLGDDAQAAADARASVAAAARTGENTEEATSLLAELAK